MKTKNIVVVGAGNTIDELFPILKNTSKDNTNYKIVGILDDDKKYYNA